MRHLGLLVFLDSTRNAVGISEAASRNVPTIALINSIKDLSKITYPVMARDFHPEFVHFFLDWVVKVANVAPQELE
jgi:ribosomal protein S2